MWNEMNNTYPLKRLGSQMVESTWWTLQTVLCMGLSKDGLEDHKIIIKHLRERCSAGKTVTSGYSSSPWRNNEEMKQPITGYASCVTWPENGNFLPIAARARTRLTSRSIIHSFEQDA
jgi:hypothetical protein